jgi:hypothetical protein
VSQEARTGFHDIQREEAKSMDIIGTSDAASVILFDIRVSEGEMQYLLIALEHLLRTLSDEELHALFTGGHPDVQPEETREFVDDRAHELREAILTYCDPQYLPAYFKGMDSDTLS